MSTVTAFVSVPRWLERDFYRPHLLHTLATLACFFRRRDGCRIHAFHRVFSRTCNPAKRGLNLCRRPRGERPVVLRPRGPADAEPRPAGRGGDSLHVCVLFAADLFAVASGDSDGEESGSAAHHDVSARAGRREVAEAAAPEDSPGVAAGGEDAGRVFEGRGLCDRVHRQVAFGRGGFWARQAGL